MSFTSRLVKTMNHCRAAFEAVVRIPNSGATASYLFLPAANVRDNNIGDALTTVLRRVLYPDIIVVVTTEHARPRLEEVSKGGSATENALRRARGRCAIYLASISQSGEIVDYQSILDAAETSQLESISSDTIFDAALAEAFSINSFVTNAPPGFTFLKPSKHRAPFFLRADEALFTSERVFVVASALLVKVAEREQTCGPIHRIMIDTMAIAPVAFLLGNLYSQFYGHQEPAIESFHSYDGLDHLSVPRTGTSFCIISASTSMNLYREWIEKTRCRPEEVVVLATLEGAPDADKSLHRISRSRVRIRDDKAKHLRDLRIVGERFNPEEIPPKAVLLKTKYHRQEHLRKVWPELSNSSALTMVGKGNGFELNVSIAGLLSLPDFHQFICGLIRDETPISTYAILTDSSNDSIHLSQFVKTEIERSYAKVVTIIYSAREIEPKDRLAGLLVVSASTAAAEFFQNCSRELRGYHEGPRRYICPQQFPKTTRDSATLKSNLEFSSTGASIKYLPWLTIPVGIGSALAWEAETVLYEQVDDTMLGHAIEKRKETMLQGRPLQGGAFLPSTQTGQPLTLRRDFAFWNPSYNDAGDHSSCLILAMQNLLQAARENGSAPEELQLSSDAFQHVVISPENFARFNDGIIQAAILRCAQSAELDYSQAALQSEEMGDIYQSVLSNSNGQQGEAALEFALALWSGKLTLHSRTLDHLGDMTRFIPDGTKHKQLLAFLISGFMSDDRPF